MKKILDYLLLALLLFFLRLPIMAQEETKTGPIEFPEFIIEGKERIDVPSGSKLYPNKPVPLTKNELDSLNPLRKQPTDLLPQKKFPRSLASYNKKSGYVKGEFGMFVTPSLEASYSGNFDEYSFFGSGSFESSNGDAKNSDYSKAGLRLITDYLAPDKYLVFGGSNTKAKIIFDTKSYNLYGASDPAARNQSRLLLSVDSDGRYEGYGFSTGAGFRTLQISDKLQGNKSNAFDNGFYGYLDVNKPFGSILAGASAEINFGSIMGKGVLFAQANVNASFDFGKDLSVRAMAGLQASESQAGVTKGGLKAEGSLEYRFDHNFTFHAGILSGLEKNSYYDNAQFNPYISTTSIVEFPYNVFLLKGFLYYHPNEVLSLSGGIKFGVMDDTPVFVSLDSAVFRTSYQSVTQASIIFEGMFEATTIDNIVCNIFINFTNMADNNKSRPYQPKLRLSSSYKRQWFDSFGTIIGLDYVGERYADIDNKKSLDAYIDVKLKFNYNIFEDLQGFLNIDNLLNSDVYIWDYYKERSIYISAGVFWKF